VNYNGLYERALYDQYRATLADYAKNHQIAFTIYGTRCPPTISTDTAVHMDPPGWRLVVDRMIAETRAG